MEKDIVCDVHPANAFHTFCDDHEKYYSDYIYLEGYPDKDHTISHLLHCNPGKVVIICDEPLKDIANNIKRKYSFERDVHKGAKNWKTAYAIITGHPKGCGQMVVVDNIKHYDTKKEAEDVAKDFTASTGINTHIILGKTPDNFNRLQTSIYYKTDQIEFNKYEIFYK